MDILPNASRQIISAKKCHNNNPNPAAGVISTGLDKQKVGRKLPVEPKTANRVGAEASLKELDR